MARLCVEQLHEGRLKGKGVVHTIVESSADARMRRGCRVATERNEERAEGVYGSKEYISTEARKGVRGKQRKEAHVMRGSNSSALQTAV
jgi:hypothetical protein